MNSDETNFWKKCKKLNKNKPKKSTCIDSNFDGAKIISIFDNKYETVLDDLNCQSNTYCGKICDNQLAYDNFNSIFSNYIDTAINKLNKV